MGSDVLFMLLRIPAILLSLTIHELAHAYAARQLGDDTAEREGRITLNPLAHLDLLGAAMLLFGPFGWAKPVPVDSRNLYNPKRDMGIVAAAGPLANIALAAVTGLCFRLGISTLDTGLATFLSILFSINIGLAVFNLLPIYPLDGSRIVMAVLSGEPLQRYVRSMKVVPMIFMGMMLAEWALNIPILSMILKPIFIPAYKFFWWFFAGH